MSSKIPMIAALALVSLAGCAKDEVHSYRTPKEAPPQLPGANANVAASAASADTPITWRAPAHWQEQPANGVRRGSFTLPGENDTSADLSIIAFPGDVGGLPANLNRWRNQIGLTPLPDAEVMALVEHADTPAFHVDFVDMVGQAGGTPTRILGAIFEYQGNSWFIKLMGPEPLVAAERENFRAFVQTVAPAAP